MQPTTHLDPRMSVCLSTCLSFLHWRRGENVIRGSLPSFILRRRDVQHLRPNFQEFAQEPVLRVRRCFEGLVDASTMTGECDKIYFRLVPLDSHVGRTGAVPFPPQGRTRLPVYALAKKAATRRSNTRPLMSLSDVACEGSHMRYFGGLVTCPLYNLPLLRVWSQRSTAPSLV